MRYERYKLVLVLLFQKGACADYRTIADKAMLRWLPPAIVAVMLAVFTAETTAVSP